MILTHLKFLKLFSWTFVFIFEFFWVCLFPRNFWPIKEWRKIEKIVKNRLFHQNSQKSTNVDFFSTILLQFFDFTPKVSLVWFWYSYDNFWWFYENLKKYFFYQKKNNFFQKKHFFFKNINYGGPLYRRRNMNTSSI